MQLLVSDSDVKSYKQIKDDLDDLRLLVEKSELWVYKAVKQEDFDDVLINSQNSASHLKGYTLLFDDLPTRDNIRTLSLDSNTAPESSSTPEKPQP